MYDEIKSQVWNHFQDLRGRIEELQSEGHFSIILRRGPFLDGKRGHFLFDQLLFARNEIIFWKDASERDSRGPD